MGHKFPTEQLTDAERHRRAADWLDAAVADLKRAAELETDEPAREIRNLIDSANTLSGQIRPASRKE